MKELKSFSSRTPSKIGNICKLVEEIISFLADNYGPLEEDNLFEMRVILNELIINSVKHGNNQDGNKYININACVDDQGYAEICLEDEGAGYDYKCIFDESAKEKSCGCELKENGRGMLLVTNLCDSVRLNECGNTIFIRKHLEKIQ